MLRATVHLELDLVGTLLIFSLIWASEQVSEEHLQTLVSLVTCLKIVIGVVLLQERVDSKDKPLNQQSPLRQIQH